ncbi:DUF3619 family protein [Methyloversatilis thermotolerans]|uniref:DUF3619 family protein n=1 Tax=Methyloversatilis thermotolerans TaxID=1346290 RepID=UPI0003818C67|nr:DUF3619 family protein [Methyloversatilis thermotolerans]
MNPSPHHIPAASIEAELGSRVHAALEASAATLPPDIAFRLRQARENALRSSGRKQRRFARLPSLAGVPAELGGAWMRTNLKSALAVSALMVLAVLANQQRHDEHIDESIDIDSALLIDDLPIDAYLDRGFGAWLDSQGETR